MKPLEYKIGDKVLFEYYRNKKVGNVVYVRRTNYRPIKEVIDITYCLNSYSSDCFSTNHQRSVYASSVELIARKII